MTFSAVAVIASLVMTFIASSTLAPYPFNVLFIAVFMALACIKFLYAIRIHTSGFLSFAALIWLFCFVVDSFMLANFATLTRETITSERRDKAKSRADLAADIERLAVEIEREKARDREVIEAELATAAVSAGACGPARAHTDGCKALAALRAEAAKADAYARRVADLAAKRRVLAATPEVIVYPEVHKLADMLRGVWPWITDEMASAALWLLVAVAVDIVPVAVIFDASRRIAPRQHPVRVPQSSIDQTDADKVLSELLRAAAGSGRVTVSLRALGAAVGLSPRRVSAALADLSTAGRLTVTGDNRGQHVVLAKP